MIARFESLLTTFQTARLEVRAIDIDDAPAMHRMTDYTDVTKNISFLSTPTSLRDVRHLITGDGDEWRIRFVGGWRRQTGSLAVIIGFVLHGAHEMEIGFWTDPACQRQNMTHEAVSGMMARMMALYPDRTIFAECRANNIAAWKLLEKLGFSATGEAGRKPLRRRLVFQKPVFNLLPEQG